MTPAKAHPIARRERDCDLCGARILRGDPHVSWTWFDYGATAGRGHAHILCNTTRDEFGEPIGTVDDMCDPECGREQWGELLRSAPPEWRKQWAEGRFHPAVLNTWLLRTLTDIEWTDP